MRFLTKPSSVARLSSPSLMRPLAVSNRCQSTWWKRAEPAISGFGGATFFLGGEFASPSESEPSPVASRYSPAASAASAGAGAASLGCASTDLRSSRWNSSYATAPELSKSNESNTVRTSASLAERPSSRSALANSGNEIEPLASSSNCAKIVITCEVGRR